VAIASADVGQGVFIAAFIIASYYSREFIGKVLGDDSLGKIGGVIVFALGLLVFTQILVGAFYFALGDLLSNCDGFIKSEKYCAVEMAEDEIYERYDTFDYNLYDY